MISLTVNHSTYALPVQTAELQHALDTLYDSGRLSELVNPYAIMSGALDSDWPHPPNTEWPRPRLGGLYWPVVGLAHYAFGCFLVDEYTLGQIRSGLASAGTNNVTVSFTDDPTNGAEVARTVPMQFLAARPLVRTTTGALTTTDNGTDPVDGWIVILVDDRYRALLTSVTSLTTTAWSDIFAAGGVTVADPVDSDYLTPGERWSADKVKGRSLAWLMDIAALSVGSRIVNVPGSTPALQRPTVSRKTALSTAHTATGTRFFGGGPIEDADVDPGQPNDVRVVFCAPSEITPAVVDVTVQTTYSWPSTAYLTHWADAPAGTSSGNRSALAAQWEADWSAWQHGCYDTQYSGFVAAPASGFCWAVEWYHDAEQGFTRFIRPPHWYGYLVSTQEGSSSSALSLWRQPVRAATLIAGTLGTDFHNGSAIDGITLATGDRILIKNQAFAVENGIYVVNASGAPTRAADGAISPMSAMDGAVVRVTEGVAQKGTTWGCSNDTASADVWTLIPGAVLGVQVQTPSWTPLWDAFGNRLTTAPLSWTSSAASNSLFSFMLPGGLTGEGPIAFSVDTTRSTPTGSALYIGINALAPIQAYMTITDDAVTWSQVPNAYISLNVHGTGGSPSELRVNGIGGGGARVVAVGDSLSAGNFGSFGVAKYVAGVITVTPGATGTIAPGDAFIGGIYVGGGSGAFVTTGSANTFTNTQTINAGAHVPALDLQQTSSDSSNTLQVRNAAGTPTFDVTGAGDVTAHSFIGPVTGNVTGNVSGSSGSCTGNAASATVLATPRTINGTSFDGSANITITAAAGTLSGATLNASVVSSSLTSVGTLTGGATGAGFTIDLTNSTVTGTLGSGRLPAFGSGDVSFAAAGGAGTIAAGAVTLAKMANVATSTVFYRTTAGTGAPEVNTLATLKSDLGLTGTNSGDQTITLTGNVTGSGTGSFVTTIASGVVTLNMMAVMATASLIYRRTVGTGAPEVQTLATLKSDLGLTGTNSGDQTITLTGDVTGSGTGSFATTIGANKVANSQLAQIATATFKGRTTAGTGNVEDLTATQATALLNVFTSALNGLVPLSGGGTANFLRADGTWVNPTSTVVILEDQKTSGTQGGTFTSGAWQTRTLNTKVADPGPICTLASNQFTLPAGTYRVRAWAMCRQVNSNQLRIQNVTDGTTAITGSSNFCASTDNQGAPALLEGRFTIGASKTFELQHQCSATLATSGFGIAGSFGTEVYSHVSIDKEAS